MPFHRTLLCALVLLAGWVPAADAGCLLFGGLGASCNRSGYGGYGASYGSYGYGRSSVMPYQYQSAPLMTSQFAPLTTIPTIPTVSTISTTALAPLTTYSSVPLTVTAAPLSVAAKPTVTVPMVIGTEAISGASNTSARLVIANLDRGQDGYGNGQGGFGSAGTDCNTLQTAGVISAIREAIDLIRVIRDVLGDGTTPPPPAGDFESRLRAVEEDVAELKRQLQNGQGSGDGQSWRDPFGRDRSGENRFGDERFREGGGQSSFPQGRRNPNEEALVLRQMMATMQKLAEVPEQLTHISSEIDSLKTDVDLLTERIEKLEAQEGDAPGN